MDRQGRRFANLARMITNPTEPKTEQTPRQEIYRKGKARLYRYESARTQFTSVVSNK
jgi:hypothetical protein